MKKQNLRELKSMAAVALACATLGWAGLNLGSICRAADAAAAPQAPSDLPSAVQEVVKLAKAGLSEEVLLAKIKNDGVSYNLTTDQIIYLSGAGVSQKVITALMQTKPGGGPTTPAAAGATNSAPAAAAQAEPPPLDAAPAGPTAPAPAAAPAPTMAPAPAATAPAPVAMAPAPAGMAPVAVAMAPAPAAMMPMAAPAGLLDNFTSDLGLNQALWTRQSDLMMRFAAVKGCRLFLPALAFGPGGMQMSGLSGPGQMMGVQSLGAFTPPFNFSATVVGMIAHGVPFEVSLVSPDLGQWVTIAGHLGGQSPGGEVRVAGGLGRVVRVGPGEASPYYGVWLNYTGGGQPISSLGYKLYEVPMAGLPYSVQVSAGADGTASVALLNSAGATVAARNGLAIGPGPFHVLLGERNGPAYANWQLAQLTPLEPEPAPVVMAVPATPTVEYFRDQLTPYGQWVEVPGAGLCWQPVVPGGWRPYYDGGHWVYTDEGWYWQSEYPWGDLAFHYGRWSFNPAFGWIWAPGFQYAPAWVVWRHTDEYCGWAPLPIGAVFVEGGWRFRGLRVGLDFDFGLSAGFFSFVACDHFWEHDFRRFIVPRDRLVVVFGRSTLISRYHMEHGHFVNEGIRVERMAQLSHRDVREITRDVPHARDVRAQEEHRNVAVRHEDHRVAASGHKVEATRQVSAARPAARSEGESHPRATASERSVSKEPASSRESTSKTSAREPESRTSTRESTSKTPAREPASKARSGEGQGEKEKSREK